jgi:hypothetical protein
VSSYVKQLKKNHSPAHNFRCLLYQKNALSWFLIAVDSTMGRRRWTCGAATEIGDHELGAELCFLLPATSALGL